jgi:hypothetical protein
MIFRLSTNFGQAQGAVGVKGRVGQHSDEIGLTDVIGTRAGDENTAGAEHLQRAEVQFFIAADGGIEVALALREGGRIEDDRVIAPTGCRVILEQIESVGFDPLDLRLARVAAIKSCVAVCNFKRGPGAVDTGYMGTARSPPDSRRYRGLCRGHIGQQRRSSRAGRGRLRFSGLRARRSGTGCHSW